MKILSSFDPERGVVVLSVTSSLLEKYYPNFRWMIGGEKKEFKVDRVDNTTASVTLKAQAGKPRGEEGITMVAIEKDLIDYFMNTVDKFVSSALRKELSCSEFCPLSGYSFQDLKDDLKVAIENKRNLIFIDTYQNYLNTKNYQYNQYEIKYGTDEWADAIILVETGKIKELKSWIEPLLKEKSWY